MALSKTVALELVRKMLEQLADEHGYLPDVVESDVKAWAQAMLAAHSGAPTPS